MKECMSGIGGNGNDFEGKPDDGSGAAELDVPKRCKGCPYVGGVTREHAADVGLEEKRKDVAHKCARILLEYVEQTAESQRKLDAVINDVRADVERNKRNITEAAQREIDEITADCPGPITATAESRGSEGIIVEFRGCDSPALGEGKRTGRYVSFDRYNSDLALEQAWQAVLALRESLLPDNYDGGEEGKYITPPRWIKEIRGASDDKS